MCLSSKEELLHHYPWIVVPNLYHAINSQISCPLMFLQILRELFILVMVHEVEK